MSQRCLISFTADRGLLGINTLGNLTAAVPRYSLSGGSASSTLKVSQSGRIGGRTGKSGKYPETASSSRQYPAVTRAPMGYAGGGGGVSPPPLLTAKQMD